MQLSKSALILVTIFIGIKSEDTSNVTEALEELPKPLEYRSPSRSSMRFTTKLRPVSSVAENLLDSHSKYTDDYNSKIETRGGYSHDSNDYGSYGSDTGYGHCSSGYVNASAVALLAFLFLLNLVQDIIQQINENNTASGRIKRSTIDNYPEDHVTRFISQGGLDTLQEGFPGIIIPMLVKLSDTNQTKCILRPMCDANAELSSKFGAVGIVLATLMSNIVSHAFTSRDVISFKSVQEAAYHGRNKESCTMYEMCGNGIHSKLHNFEYINNHDNML